MELLIAVVLVIFFTAVILKQNEKHPYPKIKDQIATIFVVLYFLEPSFSRAVSDFGTLCSE